MPNAVAPSARVLASILRRGRWLGSCFGKKIESTWCQSESDANSSHYHAESQEVAPYVTAVSAAHGGRPVSSFGNYVGATWNIQSMRLYSANICLLEDEYDLSTVDLLEFDPLGDYLDEVTNGSGGLASDPQSTPERLTSGLCTSSNENNVDAKVASQDAREPSAADKREFGHDYTGHGDGLEEPAWDNWMVLQEIGLTETEADEVMRAHRALFAYDGTEDIRSNAKTLSEYGLDLASLLRKHPTWHRLLSPNEQLEGVVSYVAAQIRSMSMSPPVDVVLLSRPELLEVSEAELKDRLAFFRSIGVTGFRSVSSWKLVAKNSRKQLMVGLGELEDCAPQLDNFKHLIQRYPALLPCPPPSTVIQAMRRLTKLFGKAKAKQFAEHHPVLLRTQPKAITDTYKQIEEFFGKKVAGEMVEKQPGLLTLQWSGMKEKTLYLTEVMGYSIHQVAECPTVLLRSLEGKIKKRHLALPESWNGKCKRSLSTIMGCSDAEFEARVRRWGVKKKVGLEVLGPIFGETGATQILLKVRCNFSRSNKQVVAKAKYIMETMGRPASDIIEYPYVLCRSLDKCIVKRHKRVGQQHVDKPLTWIFGCDNSVFESRMNMLDAS